MTMVVKLDETCEHCHKCNERYPQVWDTSDELWKRVTGIDDGSGQMCMTCFDRLAAEKGIVLCWECAEDEFPTKKPIAGHF